MILFDVTVHVIDFVVSFIVELFSQMPKTRTFGRWRAFSSDDLTVPYALEVLAYITW
jgi:hypothetical protein